VLGWGVLQYTLYSFQYTAGKTPGCLSCSASRGTGGGTTARMPSFQTARNTGHNCFRCQRSHGLFRMVKKIASRIGHAA